MNTAAIKIVNEVIVPDLHRQFEEKFLAKWTEMKQNLRQEIKEEVKNELKEEMRVNLAQKEQKIVELTEDIDELSKIHAEKNCHELQNHGVTKSGFYNLDFDGEKTGQPPSKAFCNFEENTTEVLHSLPSEYELNSCNEGPGCASVNVTYSAPIEQMKALIDNSESCYQDVKVNCTLAPLQLYGQQLGWISDDEGQKHDMSELLCEESCNCDSNENVMQSDVGRISDLNLLPLTGISYGPLEYQAKTMTISLGPLVCTGSKKSFIAETEVSKVQDRIDDMDEQITRIDAMGDQITVSLLKSSNF